MFRCGGGSGGGGGGSEAVSRVGGRRGAARVSIARITRAVESDARGEGRSGAVRRARAGILLGNCWPPASAAAGQRNAFASRSISAAMGRCNPSSYYSIRPSPAQIMPNDLKEKRDHFLPTIRCFEEPMKECLSTSVERTFLFSL